jgi:hypothetical protein
MTLESTAIPTLATTVVSKSRHGHYHHHTVVPGDASEALPASAESSECTNAATVTVTSPPVTVTVTATVASQNSGYAVDKRRRRHN